MGRIREFAAVSLDSCLSSTLTSGNMDFTVSGASFGPANSILTWQGSPGYSFTLTGLSSSSVPVT